MVRRPELSVLLAAPRAALSPAGLDPAAVARAVGPSAIHVAPGHVRIGDGWASTLVVTGYPAEVGMSWLEPLLAFPGRLDVAMHITPLATAAAAARLRHQRARLESTRRIGAERGQLQDPQIEASADDAADLADLVARGESRLFEVALYLSVHARTRDELSVALAEVRALAASVLLDTQPATWRQLQGWTSSLPLGHDGLRMRRVMDTSALATSFPLASPDLPAPLPGEPDTPGGVLYGVSPHSGAIVWWDRWAQDNHNSVVLARSGAGKSYFMKLELLRNLYDGVQIAVIDPEDEYVTLARAVAGTVIQLGGPGVHLNPLELPAGDRRPDALTRRALFLHTLVAVLLGQQPPQDERAALDSAIAATYAAAGISNDPATWSRPAPLMADLVATLAAGATYGGHVDDDPDDRHLGGHPDDRHSSGHPDDRGQVNVTGDRRGHGRGRQSGDDGHAGSGHGHVTGRGTAHGQGHAGAEGDRGSPVDGGADRAGPGASLAARLAPWTEGSFRELFAGPTTVRPLGHLIVWSTRHLPEEMTAAGMLLALDAIWHDIDSPPAHERDGLRAAHPARSGQRLGNQPDRLGNQPNRLGNLPCRLGDVPHPGHPIDDAEPAWPPRATSLPPPGTAPRRLVIVDEAWALMRQDQGALFLARMAKAARKRRAGLAVVTQDAADLLGSDLGQAVVANAATQILMRQAPQAIEVVAATFGLSPGEARMLLSAERGQALLLAGAARIPVTAVASAAEDALAATGLELGGIPNDSVANSGTGPW